MNPTLIIAAVFIYLACLLYTIGVWGEKIQKNLKTWHLVIFWLGFICDSIGTGAMSEVVGTIFKFNFHGITGITAILLMLIHAIWATIVVVKDQAEARQNFHKFSIIVWIIWLVPMLSGLIFGSSH